MTRTELIESLKNDQPPQELSQLALVLWHDGKGDWEKAHKIAQNISNADGSLIHAYLHRREGDQGNASYWYQRAGRPKPDLGLQEEWNNLVEEFLD